MKNFIVVNNDYERTRKVVDYIIYQFEKAGFVKVEKDPDFALILGGDGTFLDACKKIGYDSNILCIGINFGNLGYLLDISNTQIENLLKYLRETSEEDLNVEYVNLLEAKFYFHSSDKILTLYATNEIAFFGNRLSRIDLRVSTDNGFSQKVSVSNMFVSTATGSTGINKSNFGPVMLDEYPLLITSFNLAISNGKTDNFISNPLIYSSFNIDILNRYGNLDITLDFKDISEIEDLADVKRVELKVSDKKIKKLNFNAQRRGSKIREKMIGIEK